MRYKQYTNMFDEQGVSYTNPTDVNDYLTQCAEGNKGALKFWDETMSNGIFLMWDKKNMAKIKKEKGANSSTPAARNGENSVISGAIPIENNAAGFVPYLYHPKNDRAVGYFAEMFYKLAKKYKDEIINLVQESKDKFNNNITNQDVLEYFKHIIRERHSDWVNYVGWGKPIYWVFDIDFDELASEILMFSEFSVEYKKKKAENDIDNPQLLKAAVNVIMQVYKKRVLKLWDAYNSFLIKTDYIKDENVFNWVMERYFKDKINYFFTCYPKTEFYNNIYKMACVSLKDFAQYLQIVFAIYKSGSCYNATTAELNDSEPDEKYLFFIQDFQINILGS